MHLIYSGNVIVVGDGIVWPLCVSTDMRVFSHVELSSRGFPMLFYLRNEKQREKYCLCNTMFHNSTWRFVTNHLHYQSKLLCCMHVYVCGMNIIDALWLEEMQSLRHRSYLLQKCEINEDFNFGSAVNTPSVSDELKLKTKLVYLLSRSRQSNKRLITEIQTL